MANKTETRSISLYPEDFETLEKMDVGTSAFVRGELQRVRTLKDGDGEIDFSQMWNRQKEFNIETDYGVISERFDWDVQFGDLSNFQKTQMTQRFILKLIDEATEVLEELSWKDHKPFDPNKLDREDLLEEMIDIQKFLFCMAQVWDFTPQEWEAMFYEKTRKVERSHPGYDVNQKQMLDFEEDAHE